MFERYREDARRAIFFAKWEAEQAGSAYIEPEHILLALTHDPNSKANQLFSLSSHAENFRKQVGFRASAKSSKPTDLPLSNAGKHVLAYTAEEAERLASQAIGAEHLLLGLLRERKSHVPEALAAVGINLHSARNRIREAQGLPILDREREAQGLPILDREQDGQPTPLKSLRPFATFALLVLALSLLYLIFRLVKS